MATLEKNAMAEAKRQELLDAWLNTINELMAQVREWVGQEPDWKVEMSETDSINEKHIGPYTAPVLTIWTPEGRLILEPVARNYPGEGIIEFYAWPTCYRVRLLQPATGEPWTVMTDSGIPLHQDWNKQNFITLARDLASAP